MPTEKEDVLSWHHPSGQYYISTDPALIPLEQLNAALESEALSWASALSEDELKTMIAHSLCFGLYKQKKPNLIGFARLVTDRTTFVYITDVYILPDWQKQGLSDWMMGCVKSYTDTIKSMRQLTLIVASEKKEQYYRKKFETKRFEEFGDIKMLVSKGPAGKF